MEVLDTSFTELATCPWCGHKDRDSWELEDGEYECGECGKSYEVYREVEVTYSTSKVIKQEKQNG
jgi:DNA-directed RNA polymerase subunit RPC12/RpoP